MNEQMKYGTGGVDKKNSEGYPDTTAYEALTNIKKEDKVFKPLVYICSPYIGFEICEDSLTDASYFSAVYKEAVELCVYLCKLYGLTEKNIICHSEGYRLGIASNHSDVMHWFPKYGKSMDTFRTDVKKLLSVPGIKPSQPEPKKLYQVQVGAFSAESDAEAMLAKIKAAGFTETFIKYE